jgi:hypothetical protein
MNCSSTNNKKKQKKPKQTSKSSPIELMEHNIKRFFIYDDNKKSQLPLSTICQDKFTRTILIILVPRQLKNVFACFCLQ